MPEKTNRRTFLTDCSLVSAVGVASAAMGANTARAIEPITRNGQPNFKFSLAAYSYRDLLRGASATLTLPDFIEDCARMGLEGTELTSYYFPRPVTHEYLRSLKRQSFRLGLDVSGTAVGNDFGHTDVATRRQQIDSVKQWVDYAEILGAPVIRVFAGHVKDSLPPVEAHSLIVSALEECCDYAGQHGVHLALENHGGPTATAEGLLAFARDVHSPWFGLNIDTGNFRSNDLYGDLTKVAPYALNVQVKISYSDADGNRHKGDFRQLARLLRDAAYRGYIVLEYEEPGDPRVDCPKYVDQLREAFSR